jgi:hypothetical protein
VIRFCDLKVYQGSKYIEDFQHNKGTVFCRNGVSVWMDRKIQKNCRASVTYEEGAGRPSTATTYDNLERVRDMVL